MSISNSAACFSLNRLRRKNVGSAGIERTDASGNRVMVCLPRENYAALKTGGNDPSIARAAKYGRISRTFASTGQTIKGSSVGWVPPAVVPLTNQLI